MKKTRLVWLPLVIVALLVMSATAAEKADAGKAKAEKAEKGKASKEAKKQAKAEKAKAAKEKKMAQAEAKKDAKAGEEKPACPVWSDLCKALDRINFRYGADERVRQEYFDNIPVRADPPGITRGGRNNYFRFRTRVWGEMDPVEDLTLRARLVNETREWEHPDVSARPQRSTYEWSDEWVFDNLYLDLRNLAKDRLDLRVGRQDLIYGTGKVLLEGTPKDGSRTIYFNAAKATWKGVKDTTVDVLGIYNDSLDELALDDADRDLTGVTPANDDITESGGGVYIRNQSYPEMPYEVYALYKNESEWYSGPATNRAFHDELDLGTVGVRLMPKFSERLGGGLELAYQFGNRGDQDVRGLMADLFMTYQAPILKDLKPAVEYGVYFLSGDDPATADDEGWNPLWARYPQFSELYVYAFDTEAAGRWQNVAMPRASLSLQATPWLKTTALAGYLLAPEENGPGGGNERGLLGVLKGEFKIGEGLLAKRDKLAGHLWLEVFEPGDYYQVDETAVFARWELMYTF